MTPYLFQILVFFLYSIVFAQCKCIEQIALCKVCIKQLCIELYKIALSLRSMQCKEYILYMSKCTGYILLFTLLRLITTTNSFYQSFFHTFIAHVSTTRETALAAGSRSGQIISCVCSQRSYQQSYPTDFLRASSYLRDMILSLLF